MKQRGKKKKRMKRNEDNLRDLWDNVKHPNIQIIGVPEEDKKKGHEKIQILIKLMKIKHKEQILKAAREKQQITHKRNPIRITVDLSIETLKARREWQDILKVIKKTHSPDYCTQQGSHSNMKEKSKALQTSNS